MIDREGNDPDDSSQITYSELLKQVCKFANVLKAKGLFLSRAVSLTYISQFNIFLSLQSSAVEQVLDILMDILSWEIAEVVSPCLPRSL